MVFELDNFISNSVDNVINCGAWYVECPGNDAVRGCTCQPEDKHQNLKVMTPAVVDGGAEDVDQVGQCGSREAKVWQQLTLAVKVEGQHWNMAVQYTVL